MPQTIPQLSLFSEHRSTLDEAISLTRASLEAYRKRHRHWAIAWSGGKDSTALVTLVATMLDDPSVRPDSLRVIYADTRQELPPLQASVEAISRTLAERGVKVEICRPEMDKRFLVYILGRGVPPPNNNTLRWCTRQIKLDPMARLLANCEPGTLALTGVRQGESAVRDGRIAMSCGRNGAECGQGWYQEALPGKGIATLAPILHWRVCHVWDWLQFFAPGAGFDTTLIAEAYGGDEARESETRTGCIGCPLASRDTALETLVAMDGWRGLAPLLEIRDVYRELRRPRSRVRKAGFERRRDGSVASNPQRMGPLKLEARDAALRAILDIQHRCEPPVNLVSPGEELRIRELIAAETWPRGWDGTEPGADVALPADMFGDGSMQPRFA